MADTPDPIVKILPRNLIAARAAEAALGTGNPVSALPQSGVGNCFPGLECDLRNLERRFFPHLEVDTDFQSLIIASVDEAQVATEAAAGRITAETLAQYRAIADALQSGADCQITRLAGEFGPLGQLDFALNEITFSSFGEGRLPPDAWTAVRLLTEGSIVTLTIVPGDKAPITIQGPRTRYLDENGALARLFAVGELTQSLCSPWTHDFRDCGCYYWATNHPDIALPPQSDPPQNTTKFKRDTIWLRADRSSSDFPLAQPTGPANLEMRHHRINRDWQKLNFVLERRETTTPYAARAPITQPLADQAALVRHLQFAAGVELAVMQEYLVAAATLILPDQANEPLRGDVRAARSEILRVAIGEMRHLRAVNEVLRHFAAAGTFEPALRVASKIPSGVGMFRDRQFRALTPEVLQEFVDVEAPSRSVDSVYGRILATLINIGVPDASVQSIKTVMAEGEDHWQTFLLIQEWLGRNAPDAYLRATNPPDPGSNAQVALQGTYVALLESLYAGYKQGLPAGGPSINTARNAMLGANGIEGALDAVARLGNVPIFGDVPDPRFAAIDPPP